MPSTPAVAGDGYRQQKTDVEQSIQGVGAKLEFLREVAANVGNILAQSFKDVDYFHLVADTTTINTEQDLAIRQGAFALIVQQNQPLMELEGENLCQHIAQYSFTTVKPVPPQTSLKFGNSSSKRAFNA
ncbi:MAG: hypothetical protein ACOYK8_07610 [Alphaproteobacteria bacterium]